MRVEMYLKVEKVKSDVHIVMLVRIFYAMQL